MNCRRRNTTVPSGNTEIALYDVAIIIVSYNSSQTLARSIKSIFDFQPKKYCFQIVVVDNASQDDSAFQVRDKFPSVKLIENDKNLGFGVANNIGMASTPARYYYMHNSDAYLQDDILDSVISMLDRNPKVGIVGLPLVYPDLSPQTAAYSYTTPSKWFMQALGIDKLAKFMLKFPLTSLLLSPIKNVSVAKNYIATHSQYVYSMQEKSYFTSVDWVCGAAMLLREETRVDVNGGFDPNIFLYAEDEDICIEIKKIGWEVVHVNSTPVVHDFGWGKHRKRSKVVARLRADSLKVFIDKHFKKGSVSWSIMRLMLAIKRWRWGV